jgi:hypothetical protein
MLQAGFVAIGGPVERDLAALRPHGAPGETTLYAGPNAGRKPVISLVRPSFAGAALTDHRARTVFITAIAEAMGELVQARGS